MRRRLRKLAKRRRKLLKRMRHKFKKLLHAEGGGGGGGGPVRVLPLPLPFLLASLKWSRGASCSPRCATRPSTSAKFSRAEVRRRRRRPSRISPNTSRVPLTLRLGFLEVSRPISDAKKGFEGLRKKFKEHKSKVLVFQTLAPSTDRRDLADEIGKGRSEARTFDRHKGHTYKSRCSPQGWIQGA